MRRCRVTASVLWAWYEVWRDNGFKDTNADGDRLRPRPSRSRLRRVKADDYGAKMASLNAYVHGSKEHA